jgi:hypothetical protein
MALFHRCLGVAVLCLLPVPSAAVPFSRGDVDQGGRIDITDAIRILEKLFAGGQGIGCDDAADVDDDGTLTVSDPIFLLGALFDGGPPPSAPFPGCGEDPTDDGLSCAAFEACGLTFSFYTLELSGDAVFFVVDTSGSMQPRGELWAAKNEIRKVVEVMPDGLRFAIIFFDASLTRFPAGPEPAIASGETRASALAFLSQVNGGEGTCGAAALRSSLESASLAGARRNLVLYVSDGGGTCMGVLESGYLEKMLEEVTRANSGLARIYTIEVLNATSLGRAFMKDLAERNGGVAVRP